MEHLREKIYNILETDRSTVVSKVYDILMLFLIVASILPLAFRSTYPAFEVLDKIAVTAFIIDYLMRWMTADYKMPERKRWQAFLLYPFTLFAIIDLLSILPFFIDFNRAFKLFRISRLLKILRVFKFIRYSKNMQILFKVLHKEKNILFTVMMIAVAYIFITALIMFNIEESAMFTDFFDALYWATVSLTTVGYGDIYPVTTVGRVIAMLSSFFGIAIIALPSGIITAGFMEELKRQKKGQSKKSDKEEDRGEGPADPDDASR